MLVLNQAQSHLDPTAFLVMHHMTQADNMFPIRSKPQTAETLQKRMFISYTPKVAIHVMGKVKVLYNLTAF